MYQDVLAFHEKMGIPAPRNPGLLPPMQLAFRVGYKLEELAEFNRAHVSGDLVKAADGIADLVYFALGSAVQMGIPFEAVWKPVHAANMRKTPGVDKHGNFLGAIKPAGWIGPEAEIEAVLKMVEGRR
jgi:predicted HAD superfamily Cof-like phosphohydrolase